ncbi:nucleotidyltransferase domain-containing protein [Deefgea rivuli]|uniref:nucleotidyltransferase domain-containing protein n=1 Tax=Deefgea rivuli TaxID=400948 RepID=UPI000686D70F|nr:nucleotidyltransferase domain-containing protein [Deefgea rivuli]
MTTSTISTATRIAQRAAQLICNHQQSDLKQASQQATIELGLSKKEIQPSVDEIEAAVADYRQLFSPDYDIDLLALRQKSLALLDFFQAFQPYLMGSVLKGSANKHSDINLLVYSDDPKAIEIFLLNQQIDYSCRARKTQFRQTDAPAIAFWFDNTQVHLQVLPSIARHQNSKKNDRANYEQLKQLIANYQSNQVVATEK